MKQCHDGFSNHHRLDKQTTMIKEAVAILDTNGIIKYVSPLIVELLGYRRDELEGTDGLLLLYKTSFQKVRNLYNELQRHSALLMEGLLKFQMKNGEKTSLYVHANNLLAHPGINGVLVHLRRFRGESPEEADTSIVEQFVRLNIDARKKVQEEIAAELHDNINPSLLAVKLLLDYSRKDLDNNYAELDNISSILQNLIYEVRDLSRTLVNKPRKNFELYEALNTLVDNFRRCKALRLVIKFDKEIEGLLDYRQKMHLLRILQEQITNIIKHAGATKALITLQCKKGRAVITTRDNGVGMDTEVPKTGIGLSNTLNRVNELEGIMHIRSRPGEGTTIQIEFPLE